MIREIDMVYVTNAGSNSVSVISITTFIQPPVNKNDNAIIHSSFEGVEAQVAMRYTTVIPQQQMIMNAT